MKTCEEITKLMSEAQDRKMSLAESFAAQTHLVLCGGCRNYKKQLNFLREAMRAYAQGGSEKNNPNDRV